MSEFFNVGDVITIEGEHERRRLPMIFWRWTWLYRLTPRWLLYRKRLQRFIVKERDERGPILERSAGAPQNGVRF